MHLLRFMQMATTPLLPSSKPISPDMPIMIIGLECFRDRVYFEHYRPFFYRDHAAYFNHGAFNHALGT